MHLSRRESVERLVEGGIDRDKLTLQMGRKLGNRQAVAFGRSGDLVAIGLRLRSLGEVEQASVPSRNLDTLVAKRRGPFAN
jgi:hypothetical protein